MDVSRFPGILCAVGRRWTVAACAVIAVACPGVAGAVSRRACRLACADLITACVQAGHRHARCTTQLIRLCRGNGLAFCASGTTSTSTSTTVTSTTSTTFPDPFSGHYRFDGTSTGDDFCGDVPFSISVRATVLETADGSLTVAIRGITLTGSAETPGFAASREVARDPVTGCDVTDALTVTLGATVADTTATLSHAMVCAGGTCTTTWAGPFILGGKKQGVGGSTDSSSPPG